MCRILQSTASLADFTRARGMVAPGGFGSFVKGCTKGADEAAEVCRRLLNWWRKAPEVRNFPEPVGNSGGGNIRSPRTERMNSVEIDQALEDAGLPQYEPPTSPVKPPQPPVVQQPEPPVIPYQPEHPEMTQGSLDELINEFGPIK